ncbi:GMC family oxidoreductase [Puniceibacterium sp. IMCC21224]|uniref:GMC family oxidoreductase n=1 Tax=Puniceibacterium sp. IMCC21224 TaxID=1618204 RepID=UPI00064DA866|nr:GMC family oxidoreductase [Puniceibacterium sp. IMCC21224]KMK64895.1 choline dehydrogenase-like flavoprotein [Puniceibacterium sp. IMCC21224]
MTDIADIAIVGAGAAGLAFAWAVAAPDLRVVVLEAGSFVDQRNAPSLSPDWELALQRNYNANPNVRRGPADYPVDDGESAIKPAIFNAVGGSTIRWGAHFPRFRPSDFRRNSLDHVAADWPVTYDELEAFYDLNDQMMGVSGLAGDPGNPPRAKRPSPPLPLCAATERLAAAFDRLGWHWWPSDAAILSSARPGRAACNNCGPCGVGCPRHARASADVAYLEAAQARGVEIRHGAVVTGLKFARNGRDITGLRYVDAEGTKTLSCGEVVLAGNALGNARLLGGVLDHPLFGRGLMLHPTAIVTGIFDDNVQSWRGPFASAMVCQEFYESDPGRGFTGGFQLQALRGQGPLTTALGGYGLRLPWGRGHAQTFDARFGRSLSLTVTCDDLPEEHNRIALHDTRRDRFGLPVPQMIYRVGDNSRKMLDFGIQRASEALRGAGARDIAVNPLTRNAGFHLMGTARMGVDDAQGVTDEWGRVYGLGNLSIVDASTFVTAAAVNPTPTLQALALRAATAMRDLRAPKKAIA